MRRRPGVVYPATSRRKLRMELLEKRLIKLGLEEWLPESIKDLREVTGGQQFYEMERIGRANVFRGQASAMRARCELRRVDITSDLRPASGSPDSIIISRWS